MAKLRTCASCVSIASLWFLAASGPAAAQATARPKPPVLCLQGSDCSDTVDDGGATLGTVLVALTFEQQLLGPFVTGVVYEPEIVTTQQSFETAYNQLAAPGATVTVIDDPEEACKGDRFARSMLPAGGNAYRAELNFNDPGGDLRSKETNWQSDRPDRWMGMCIRLDADYPYPAPGYPVVWQTHCYAWLDGEPPCGPGIGLRAGHPLTNGTRWTLTFEGDSTRSYDLGRDLDQDRGVWRYWVIHWIAGSNGSIDIWVDGTTIFSVTNESTYPDSATYFAYEVPIGLYNGYCKTTSCPTFTVDYDELRYADGSGLTEAEGLATVSPASY